jgi:hypothetical protein
MWGFVLLLCNFVVICTSNKLFDQEVCLLQQNAFLQRYRMAKEELKEHAHLPKYDEGLNWPFSGVNGPPRSRGAGSPGSSQSAFPEGSRDQSSANGDGSKDGSLISRDGAAKSRPVHSVPRTPPPGTEFLFDAPAQAGTEPTPPPTPYPEYYPCNAFEVMTTSGKCGHCTDYMCDRVSLHVKDVPKACRVCSYCIQHSECAEYAVKHEHQHRDHQPLPDRDLEPDDDMPSESAEDLADESEDATGDDDEEYPGKPVKVHLPSTSFALSVLTEKDSVDTATPALLIEALNQLEHARHSESLEKVVDSDLTSAYWLLQEAFKTNALQLANTSLDQTDHVLAIPPRGCARYPGGPVNAPPGRQANVAALQ